MRRRGKDLTIVATSVMVGKAMAAAEELAADGVDVDRRRPPHDHPAGRGHILREVAATGKALLVQEAPRTAGFVAEIAARIAESDTFHTLKAPIVRLCGLDAPIAYAPELEKASVPQIPDIVAAARLSRNSVQPDRARGAHPHADVRPRRIPRSMTVPEVPIRMPKMSMTMEEGEFTNWLVSVGDTITKGQAVAVVMTDKVEMEVESEVEGTVTRLTAAGGRHDQGRRRARLRRELRRRRGPRRPQRPAVAGFHHPDRRTRRGLPRRVRAVSAARTDSVLLAKLTFVQTSALY